MNWWTRPKQEEASLEGEISDHIDRETEMNIEAGMSPTEARYAARRKFGNVTLVREETHAVWFWMWLEHCAQDLRYALRMLRSHPGFTTVAVLSLALGIGANTAIFGLLDVVMLRTLPVRNPEELHVVAVAGRRGKAVDSHSYPLYVLFRDHNHSFQSLAGTDSFTWKDKSVTSDNTWHAGQMVSGNYFDVLGVRSIFGRVLTPEDDSVEGSGGPRGTAGMLSYNYWRRGFRLDPGVLGKQINVNGAWVTIVGVTPPEFFGTVVGASPDIFVPLQSQPAVMPPGNLLHDPAKGSTTWVTVMGRLQRGVSAATARADLTLIENQYDISRMSPSDQAEYGKKKGPLAAVVLQPGSRGLSRLREQFSEPLRVLMALVGIVLLIACANVANLLLSRANARRKEIAVRLAIGAGRARIVRQLLTESLLLAIFGGGLGLIFAIWSSGLLIGMMPQGQIPLALEVRLDARVLAFTFGLAIITGLLFGLAPALHATRSGVNDSLKQVKAALSRSSRFDLVKALVIVEVTLSLLLLVGAGLFIGTLRNLATMNAGFLQQNVVQVRINLDAAQYPRSQWRAIYDQIVERVAAVPGVQAVSLANRGLLQNGKTSSGPLHIAGYTFRQNESRDLAEAYVGPDYFTASGIALRSGRSFKSQDETIPMERAVVNQEFARHFFAGQDPVGKRYGFGDGGDTIEIIGVVADAKYNSLREDSFPMAYYLWKKMMPARLGAVIVRTAGDSATILPAIRRSVTSVNPDILLDVSTLSHQIDDSLLRERLLARLSGFFGVLAMLLAAIGLYGVMAYGVTRRTSEIGVRIALGALPGNVVWMIVREALALVAAGVMIGVPLALGLSRFTQSFLWGLTPDDPLVMAVAATTLLVVGALSGYFPARRASHVDPIRALRYD